MLNELYEKQNPQLILDYSKLDTLKQKKLQYAIATLMDVNPNETIFTQNLVIMLNNREIVNYVKSAEQKGWLNSIVAIDIACEWQEPFDEMFKECKERLSEYGDILGTNIMCLYIDLKKENLWIYGFQDSMIKSMDDNFIKNYVGEVLSREESRKRLEEYYM